MSFFLSKNWGSDMNAAARAASMAASRVLGLHTIEGAKKYVSEFLLEKVDPNKMVEIKLPGTPNVLRMRAVDLIPLLIAKL